jgi:hypothetical protein
MRVTGLSAGIPGTGLSATVERNPDQPGNIYWLGDFAATTVPKFTLGKRPEGRPSLPADFERAIQEDEISHNWWIKMRMTLANYIMPEKHFPYHNNPELTSDQLLSNRALNIQPAPDERDA